MSEFPVVFCLLADTMLGSIYAASVIYALPNGGWYGLTITQRLIASTWVFGFVHNVSVTGAIVTRLWWMGRTMASLARTSTNRFSSSVYIVIESGAISATCDVFVLTLFATHNSASFSCLDVVAQLAVCNVLHFVPSLASALTGLLHLGTGRCWRSS